MVFEVRVAGGRAELSGEDGGERRLVVWTDECCFAWSLCSGEEARTEEGILTAG